MPDPLRPHHRLTLEELESLSALAGSGELSPEAGTRLLEYAMHLPVMIDGVYAFMVPAPGTEMLQAELELEVLAIREEQRRKGGN